MDPNAIRKDFPPLSADPAERVIYFDNACMTLKPEPVIEAMLQYYREFPACGERSVHRMSNAVTVAVEEARASLQRLVGAPDPGAVVFTKNTTEAINHVAWCSKLQRGDVVLTSDREHNSNLIPWKQRARLEGIRHEWFPTTETGAFDEEAFKAAVSQHRHHLKLVSVVHVSNLDGQRMPIETITEIVHDAGARVLVDGAQSVPHTSIDVEALGVDYFAWSVHKMMGPTGMGCLYGTDEALRALEPRYLGGNTVADSRLEGFDLLDPPHVFEAGLQNYAGILGSGAAAEYLMRIGPDEVHDHEVRLNQHLTRGIIDRGLGTIHGPEDARLRGGILPFTVPPLDSHDVALYLDEAARVALRSGAHCVHSFLNARGLDGWARASLYAYNTIEECDVFLDALTTLQQRLTKTVA